LNRDELKHRTFMVIAGDLSGLSTCSRKRVGAVIVKEGRCITWGYNGAPPGLPHCDENFHGWDNSEEITFLPEDERQRRIEETKADLEEFGCRNATHAEANALAYAAKHGISTDGGTLYVTVSPCEVCARLLIAAGIETVYYDEEYRDYGGISLLKRAGARCIHWPYNGRPLRSA